MNGGRTATCIAYYAANPDERGYSVEDLSSITLTDILNVANKAGETIKEVYDSDFSIEHKEDRSPLTLADTKSNEIIMDGLKRLYPRIPVLSEEGRDIPYTERKEWKHFWLVDPLDGTKEFINRNGEFTVNIALIHNGRPVLGVILIPVINVFYFSKNGTESYRLSDNNTNLGDADDKRILEISERLPLAGTPPRPFTVVASRSHMSGETEEFISRLRKKHGKIDIVSSGSSIKLCMVAEGIADLYPRFGPTMEWDTAAGHAIVKGAGGEVTDTETGEPLTYNKEDLLNPWFIVKGKS